MSTDNFLTISELDILIAIKMKPSKVVDPQVKRALESIKPKIGSLVESALEIMFFLVNPDVLSHSETFQMLIFEFISKAMERETGAILNFTAGKPQRQHYLLNLIEFWFNSTFNMILCRSN